MTDEIIYRGVEIKNQIKLLTEEYKMISPQIIKRIRELSQDKEKEAVEVGELGTYQIIRKPRWGYSDKVKALEHQLKEQKAMEEQTGVADVVSYTEYPQFNPANNEKH